MATLCIIITHLPNAERPDPIVQALKREVAQATKLHKIVKKELENVFRVCKGEDKPTNAVRDIMSTLSKGSVPPKWRVYVVPASITASQWFADFARRCQHLSALGAADPTKYNAFEINLGLLLYPGAFITATRQSVARMLEFPLEKLKMSIDIATSATGAKNTDDGGSFLIGGMTLQSCQLQNNRLELLHGKLHAPCGVHRLWWRKDTSHALPKGTLQIPLYLNPSRAELLAKLDLPVDPNVEEHEWYQV